MEQNIVKSFRKLSFTLGSRSNIGSAHNSDTNLLNTSNRGSTLLSARNSDSSEVTTETDRSFFGNPEYFDKEKSVRNMGSIGSIMERNSSIERDTEVSDGWDGKKSGGKDTAETRDAHDTGLGSRKKGVKGLCGCQ